MKYKVTGALIARVTVEVEAKNALDAATIAEELSVNDLAKTDVSWVFDKVTNEETGVVVDV